MKKIFKSKKKYTLDWSIYIVFSILLGFSVLSLLYSFIPSSYLISILEIVIIGIVMIPVLALTYVRYIINDNVLIIKYGILIKKISIYSIHKLQIHTNNSFISLLGQINTISLVTIYYEKENHKINITPNDISTFISCLKKINNSIEICDEKI